MRPSAVPSWVWLACLALGLRPQLFGITPLFPVIQDEFEVPFSTIGLLVTVPVLAMGIASLAGPSVIVRLGIGGTVSLALAVLGGAGLLRAGMPDMPGLLLASIPLGIAAGLGGIALPMITKSAVAAGRVASATATYTAGLQLGGAAAAAIVVPIAGVAGGWRASLALLAVATLVLFVAWLAFRPSFVSGSWDAARSTSPAAATRRWLPATVAAFAMLIILFQGLNAWLPALLVEQGRSARDAGLLLAVLVIAQVPGTLAAGLLADRVGSRRSYIVGAALVLLVTLVLLAAGAAGTWLWAAGAGLALGAMAPIILVLPADFGPHPRAVARSSAKIFGVGYVLASAGPFALGVVRDATGSFVASMLILAGVAAALVGVAMTIPRNQDSVGAATVDLPAGQ